MYVSYDSALKMYWLQSLHDRREHRSLQFAIKCTQHRTNKEPFPLNPFNDIHMLRNRKFFKVNRARAEEYKKHLVPYLQKHEQI